MRATLFICLLILIWVSVLEAQIVTDGLVSYYNLDGDHIDGNNVRDLVGSNHATIVGEPESVAGHFGDALKFDGVDDYVELPQIFAIGVNPVTYECRFNKTDKTGWQYLISNKVDFGSSFFRLGFNKDSGQVRMYTEQEDNANKSFVTDGDYADGEWHHVVATREGNQAKVYVDGELVKEDEAMAGDIGGDRTNWFLAQDGNSNGYLNGAMDEVRIYNRALTAGEIQTNFVAVVTSVDSMNKLSITWGAIKHF